MLPFITEIIYQIKILNIIYFYFLFYSLSFIIIFFYNNNKISFLRVAKYDALQKVHVGDVTRLGGFIIYVCLWFLSIIFNDLPFFRYILFCILPMMVITLIEDLFHNVNYKIRFIGIIFSSIFLILFTITNFPEINYLPVISSLFEYKVFNIAFFSLCLLIFANGCNFIDGMNGLTSFFMLGSLLSCFFLAYIVNDYESGKLLLLYGLALTGFISINYPWGKIFLGDSGSFLFALLIGIWVINFFGNNSTISSWNVVLMFFYPTIEVLYSFVRKLCQGKSPFKPDREHLHLKIFDTLKIRDSNPKLANNLTTIYLSFFWLSPSLFLPLVYNSNVLLFVTLTMLTISYLTITIKIPATR